MSNFYHRIQNINKRKTKGFTNSYGDGNWLNYIAEAMKPLSPDLTNKILTHTSYIKDLLKNELRAQNIKIDFIHSGSTAYDTHISSRGKVDIYMVFQGYSFSNSENPKPIEISDIINVKETTKLILQKLFPEVLLDDSQPLALEMSIQSWLCNYCLFFGFWNDNRACASGIYSNQIQLLNKETLSFEVSNPIIAKHNINKKDHATNGNVKTLIRVIKNLKSDSIEAIPLTGFQIESMVYSMDNYTLEKPSGQILLLLLEFNMFIEKLCNDPFKRRSLRSCDNHHIVNSSNEESFVLGCKKLQSEIERNIKHLVLEMDLYQSIEIYNQT